MADGTYCFARLRVARANRAVTLFALFRFAFPTLSAVFAVFVWSFRYTAFPPLIPQRHCLPQVASLCFSFAQSLRKLRFFSLYTHTLAQHPKLHSTAKNRASPATLWLVSSALRAISVRHPRSTRRRLAPLHSTSQKITSLIFHLFHSGSGLFYLFGLSRFAHTQPPTTHPLNTVDDIFYLRSTQIFKCNQRENKKNAHKDNSKKISQ